MRDWKVHVNSENNFPTAAGLASSAAGYACLVYALCQMYGVTGDISGLARQGSGSACRSVDGGFVRWRMGGTHVIIIGTYSQHFIGHDGLLKVLKLAV